MKPVDVLFIANILEKTSRYSKMMSTSEALKFIAMQLVVGVREHKNGERDTLYRVGVEEGKIMGDKI